MSGTKTVWARVNPAKTSPMVFKAGMQFTRGWRRVEVDAATASALQAEALLDISFIDPNTPREQPQADVAEEAEPAKLETAATDNAVATKKMGKP